MSHRSRSIPTALLCLRLRARHLLLASCSVIATMAMPNANAFDVLLHASITSDALKDYSYTPTGRQAIGFLGIAGLKFGNSETDRNQDPVLHCDNERTGDCVARVNVLRQWIIDDLGDGEFAIARDEFAKALHTIQDFYAHTTWVEYHSNPARPFAAPALSGGRDCEQGHMINGPRFTSGHYDAASDANSYNFLQELSAAGFCLHGQRVTRDPLQPLVLVRGIAKDFNGPLHEKAKEIARQASREFVDTIRDGLPANSRDAGMCGLMGHPVADCVTDSNSTLRTVTVYSIPRRIRVPVPLLYEAQISETYNGTNIGGFRQVIPDYMPLVGFQLDRPENYRAFNVCRVNGEWMSFSDESEFAGEEDALPGACSGSSGPSEYISKVSALSGQLTVSNTITHAADYSCVLPSSAVESTTSSAEEEESFSINLQSGNGAYELREDIRSSHRSRGVDIFDRPFDNVSTYRKVGGASGTWNGAPLQQLSISVSTVTLMPGQPMPAGLCSGP